MLKKIRGIVALTLLLSLAGGMTSSYASGDITGHSGTDRFFRTELPHEYGNKYFMDRAKETNEQNVVVRIVEKDNTLGMSTWVRNSNKVRISQVSLNMSALNRNYYVKIIDRNNATKGKNIHLGLENAEHTMIVKDEIAGYVNYR